MSAREVRKLETIHIEQVALSSDRKTRDKLVSLFLLPKILAGILETSGNELTDIFSAKLFLLSRLNELLPALMARDRNKSIEVINNFVALWLSSRQAASRLSFEDGCTINRDCTFIWLPEIKALNLANPGTLQKKWHSNWGNYLPKFDLVDSPDGFFVEIPFSVKSVAKKNNKLEVRKPKPQATKFGSGVSVKEFFNALKMHRMELDRVARAYVKPDFGALSGHQVQGGLPSLGKRR